jgi:hypothetical protein
MTQLAAYPDKFHLNFRHRSIVLQLQNSLRRAIHPNSSYKFREFLTADKRRWTQMEYRLFE